MASYKPKNLTLTATNMNNNNGAILNASNATLTLWDRILYKGIVKNAAGNLVTNAAVEVKKIATAGSTSLGIIFTNAHGEYGVSLPILSQGQQYRFDSYVSLQ